MKYEDRQISHNDQAKIIQLWKKSVSVIDMLSRLEGHGTVLRSDQKGRYMQGRRHRGCLGEPDTVRFAKYSMLHPMFRRILTLALSYRPSQTSHCALTPHFPSLPPALNFFCGDVPGYMTKFRFRIAVPHKISGSF